MRLPLLFTAICLTGLLNFAQGQTVILDFEDASTTTTFQSFGGAVEGVVDSPIANPDASGVNTSDSVMVHVKPSDAPDWGGAFSNPVPTSPVDLTAAGSTISMKVWMPTAGVVRLKLEEGTAGNWELDQTASAGGQWVDMTWDASVASAAGDGVIAAGNTYNKVVVFFDFGTPGNGTDNWTYYFDDLVVNTPPPPPATGCVNILDFEDAATTTNFQYFGSGQDGTAVGPIANPDKSGINMSDSVMIHVRPADAVSFAGAFTNPNPATAIDLTNGDSIRMKVWMPDAGNVMLKLEESTTGGSNWEVKQDVSTVMEWVEVVWDPATPSDPDGVLATGNIYNKIVVFFDFGDEGVAESTFYFDDICVGTEAVSIKPELVRNLFTIAPNPTRDFVNISLEATPAVNAEVSITDLQGRVVYNSSLEAGATSHQVQVSDLTAGMYMVRVNSGNTFGIKKLIVR